MTNRQERFLVMTEAEFERAMLAAELVGTGPEFMRKTLIGTREIAEAACRAREVPAWATHFTGVVVEKWNGGDAEGVETRHEEIKK